MAAPAEGALRFDQCKSWECATLRVPLDHSGGRPGTIALHVERIGASKPARGALIALAGGPGQAAAPLTEDFNRELFPGLETRDLIVYDQRGTGESGALRCPELQSTDMTDAGDEAAACARRLGAKRAFYTTRDTVADIEALRQALAVERITLYGVSYGTKVALAYAATYPDRVERLILDSVVPWPAGADAFYSVSTMAMPRVLRALCRSRCGAITPDPAADLERVVDRIADRGLSGTAFDGSGRPHRVPIRRLDLFGLLLVGDLFPPARADLPAALASAARGDRALLARAGYVPETVGEDFPGQRPEEYSQALFAATMCEETELPWDRTAPPAERLDQARERVALMPGSAFEPFDRETALSSDTIRLCEKWPAAADPPVTPAGPLPDVPVLIMNGEDDLRTPLAAARDVQRLFPRATLVTDSVGHSVLFASECAQAAVRPFFRDRAAGACRRTRRPPLRELPPLSVGELRPLGARGLRGRTLRALEATLRDIRPRLFGEVAPPDSGQPPGRAGGLRGGYLRWGTRLTLTRYAYVPGVRVGGTLRIERGGAGLLGGVFRLGGRAAAAGRVELRRGRLTGTLAGRAVTARLRVPSATAAARPAAVPWTIR
jgi:pimeloyl-ACP methyl ester carboxylesterase